MQVGCMDGCLIKQIDSYYIQVTAANKGPKVELGWSCDPLTAAASEVQAIGLVGTFFPQCSSHLLISLSR